MCLVGHFWCYELLKPGDTVTANVYCQQLKEKRPALVNRKQITPHHDNAKPHTESITRENIRELNWEVLNHPPYSPIKIFLDLWNKNISKFNRSAKDSHQGLFQFKTCKFFEKWIIRWETVLRKEGNYTLN